MPNPPSVVGYLDRLTYRAGDRVTVFASGSGQSTGLRLVELGRGPVPGRDLPSATAEISWEGAGDYPLARQDSCVGSFATTRIQGDISSSVGVTIGLDLWTSLPPSDEPQTVWDLREGDEMLALELVGSHLRLRAGDAYLLTSSVPVSKRSWTSIHVELLDSSATLDVLAHSALYGASGTSRSELPRSFAFRAADLTFAAREPRDVTHAETYARGRARGHLTAKLANPFFLRGGGARTRAPTDESAIKRLVATHGGGAWSLAPVMPGARRYECRCIAGTANPLVLVNLPNQGVTGPNWDGSSVSFRETPELYAAAHFHSTDLVDAGWTPTMSAPLPSDLASGVYGVELAARDGSTDTIPLFLGASTTSPARPRLAFLMPTFTYLAYANEDLIGHFEAMIGHKFSDPAILAQAKAQQVFHSREYGKSLYDEHPDGSGVHYSSSLRPILDMRPEYTFWSYTERAGRAFSGDLYLTEWLKLNDYPFEVITDEQLHVEGAALLHEYDAVVTGSHPEYPTAQMLDALEAYRDRGGNLCYLGGNGFYWVTGVVDATAPVVETRRGHMGVRSWDSAPGEVDLVSSWEPGGLWRYRGRAPQRLFGVGMAGAGGQSRPYRISEDRRVRDAAGWFFDGLEGDLIGEHGFVRGGAAGDEYDRVDVRLGTPPGALVLAASWDHEIWAQRAIEEVQETRPGSTDGPNDPEIRADMVYFDTPSGGSVFATGSIAYFGALLVNGGRNNASRALRNVLDHMLGRTR